MLVWLFVLAIRCLAWTLGVAFMVAIGFAAIVYTVMRGLLMLAFGARRSSGPSWTSHDGRPL